MDYNLVSSIPFLVFSPVGAAISLVLLLLIGLAGSPNSPAVGCRRVFLLIFCFGSIPHIIAWLSIFLLFDLNISSGVLSGIGEVGIGYLFGYIFGLPLSGSVFLLLMNWCDARIGTHSNLDR